jgi:hypothetical protein
MERGMLEEKNSDTEPSADDSNSPPAGRWSDILSSDSMPGLVADSDTEFCHVGC